MPLNAVPSKMISNISPITSNARFDLLQLLRVFLATSFYIVLQKKNTIRSNSLYEKNIGKNILHTNINDNNIMNIMMRLLQKEKEYGLKSRPHLPTHIKCWWVFDLSLFIIIFFFISLHHHQQQQQQQSIQFLSQSFFMPLHSSCFPFFLPHLAIHTNEWLHFILYLIGLYTTILFLIEKNYARSEELSKRDW